MTPGAPTVVIVEDDRATRRFLADNLSADGYEPVEAETAQDGRRLLSELTPELAIIDLGLPDRDGLDLLRELRAGGERGVRLDPQLPVLVLSGRAGELDRVRGFERGADDYLVKPFSYPELRGRIAALLRLAGEPVVLSKKEFALLRALASDPTRVYTREELLRGVWGFQSIGRTRTLDSHASRLRKKLSAGGEAFIVNVWGVGYRLIDGEVER